MVNTPRTAAILLFSATLLCRQAPADSEIKPERSKGISMHMLPKAIADLGEPKMKWGLIVRPAKHLKAEKGRPVLQTTDEFLGFVRKQSSAVQAHGVWIVTTNPEAYTAPETKLLDDIKALCRKEKIPLFVVRGSELPNGWKRYDKD
jgi:hypothetical protein